MTHDNTNEMLVEQLIKKYYDELKELYDESEIKAITQNALRHALKFSSPDIILKKQEKINAKQLLHSHEILNRLKTYEPLQYIVGETDFLRSRFLVNKNVLIPRPETEELVEWIIEEYNEQITNYQLPIVNYKGKIQYPTSDFQHPISEFRILDIGTGSGCIAISLKKNIPHSKVTAVDISEDALLVARKNAALNETEINFIQVNILNSSLSSQHSFNLIVSNPPYISSHEKMKMHRNVTDHEPHIALFVEDKNPLLFYERIAHLASGGLLKRNGSLYFEMNENLSYEISDMLSAKGFTDVAEKQDISGKSRMIHAVKK
ncbi:MAG: peptide chain release factor N(5)-glutamine methyltransferase [Bacteroidia bacterium]